MAPSTRTRIGPADHGRRLTLDDFIEAEVEEGHRYELARGVLEVTEVPDDPHGQVEFNLLELILDYKRRHPGLIRRVGSGSSVRLWIPEMASGRNPDLAIVFASAPKDDRGRRHPRWAAEVVSPGAEARDRDYRTKPDEYLAYGIEEYWIVDPERRHVTVLLRRAGPDGPAWGERTFADDQTVESRLLPGIAVPVASLWDQADLDGDD